MAVSGWSVVAVAVVALALGIHVGGRADCTPHGDAAAEAGTPGTRAPADMSTHAKFVQAIAAAPDAATRSMACVGLADSMWWFSAATLADGTSASSKDLYVAAITLAADTSAVAKGYVGLGDTLWRGQQATVNGTRVGKAAAADVADLPRPRQHRPYRRRLADGSE